MKEFIGREIILMRLSIIGFLIASPFVTFYSVLLLNAISSVASKFFCCSILEVWSCFDFGIFTADLFQSLFHLLVFFEVGGLSRNPTFSFCLHLLYLV